MRLQLVSGEYFDIELFCTEGDDCPVTGSWESIPTADRTSGHTGSAAAMDVAEAWMEECLSEEEDEFCDAPEEAELPTRVVDVGAEDGSLLGKEQIITTTMETYEERKREIKTEELSRTFADAVEMTRRLGLRYIWIDSLCIIQDDLSDWRVESAKMCDVYSRAYLTLAATHSNDGRAGLFRETPDFEVNGTTAEGEEYRIFFRERVDHHLEESGDDYRASIGHPTKKHYPILTRAWVYQERLLSTRVLHFGRYELFFECRSEVRCECGGIGWHGSSAAAPTLIPSPQTVGRFFSPAYPKYHWPSRR
ncbi:hypothetical protein OQA88_1974 [Cercophora sp. LCS_1]